MLICTLSVFAKNNVETINIDVAITNDGSAYVTQEWTGTFEQGTENYIPIENLNGITISDFSVSDTENGKYDYIDFWDVDSNFDEKAGKCGIVETSRGYELCFGITEYGYNTYTISYKLNGLVCCYSDYDGFNFMFINSGMSTFPTQARINIYMLDGTELNENNSGIWGFGYEGGIYFVDGGVYAYTDNELYGSDSMIVMLQLDKDIVTPERHSKDSFEIVKERAFEQSDYKEENDKLDAIICNIMYAVFAVILALITGCAVRAAVQRIKYKKFYKSVGYFRDIPNGGSIPMSYCLAKNFKISGEESVISACILKMIVGGNLRATFTETPGMFGKIKKSVELSFVSAPEETLLNKMYQLLKNAAGNDEILQEKEMDGYFYSHPDAIRDFVNNAAENGKNELMQKQGLKKSSLRFIDDLTEKGRAELAESIGLRKYLSEFSLISERELSESAIWKDYMVYAVLYGIGDKVMEQLRKLYPNGIPQEYNFEESLYAAMCCRRCVYDATVRKETEARMAGGGGSSSHYGGGGFSGGGCGGGSR